MLPARSTASTEVKVVLHFRHVRLRHIRLVRFWGREFTTRVSPLQYIQIIKPLLQAADYRQQMTEIWQKTGCRLSIQERENVHSQFCIFESYSYEPCQHIDITLLKIQVENFCVYVGKLREPGILGIKKPQTSLGVWGFHPLLCLGRSRSGASYSTD